MDNCYLLALSTILSCVMLTDSGSLCPSNKFRCKTKFGLRCLSNSWRCDGKHDCEDNHDEKGCTSCNSDLWACKSSSPTALRCLDKSWRCDGRPDCEDGSDELDCDKTTKPVVVTVTAQVPPNETRTTVTTPVISKRSTVRPVATVSSVTYTSSNESNLKTPEIVAIVTGVVILFIISSGGIFILCILKKGLCHRLKPRVIAQWRREGPGPMQSINPERSRTEENTNQRNMEEGVPLQSTESVAASLEEEVSLQPSDGASATTVLQGQSTTDKHHFQVFNDDPIYESSHLIIKGPLDMNAFDMKLKLVLVHKSPSESDNTQSKPSESDNTESEPSENDNTEPCESEDTELKETLIGENDEDREGTNFTMLQHEPLQACYLFRSREKLPT